MWNIVAGRKSTLYTTPIPKVSPSEMGMFKAPKTYGVEIWEGDIKIASAGIKKGLVTLEDLYRAIIGNKEVMEKVYNMTHLRD